MIIAMFHSEMSLKVPGEQLYFHAHYVLRCCTVARLSVCLSVTFRCFVQTNEDTIVRSSFNIDSFDQYQRITFTADRQLNFHVSDSIKNMNMLVIGNVSKYKSELVACYV